MLSHIDVTQFQPFRRPRSIAKTNLQTRQPVTTLIRSSPALPGDNQGAGIAYSTMHDPTFVSSNFNSAKDTNVKFKYKLTKGFEEKASQSLDWTFCFILCTEPR